jgi:hypothetical protein
MTHEKPSDKDSLVYENVTGTNLIIYKSILHNAGRDPVNPIVFRKCKCGNNYARQVRLGNEMKLINTCIECGDQWLDGTRDVDNVQGSAEKSKKGGKKKTKTGGEKSKDEKPNGEKSKDDTSDSSTSAKKTTTKQKKESRKELTLSSKPKNDNAYVWFLIKGDAYVPGVIASIYSVKRYKPKADLVVMVTDDVPDSACKTLLQHATHLFYIPYLSYPNKFRYYEGSLKKYGSWINVSFTKWNMLALPYKKAFLLDADVLAVNPLDVIFTKKAPAAVFMKPFPPKLSDDYQPDVDYDKDGMKYADTGHIVNISDITWIFNHQHAICSLASSILLAPDMKDYELFKQTMETIEPYQFINETGLDEQSITYFYSFIKKENWLSLGKNWNLTPWKKDKVKTPYVIHFMQDEKPWNMDKNKWPDIAEWHEVYEEALKSVAK